MELPELLNKFHPGRRQLIAGLLLAAGTPPVMLSILKRAMAMSEVPVVEGVNELSGDVTINGIPAQAGQLVKAGDVVRTGGGDSHVIIVIGEHAYLLREDSEIEFSLEDITSAQGAALSGQINMVAGAMLAVFAKSPINITTPMATIGIRGTACYIDSSDARTYACICYGTGEFYAAGDNRFLETVATTYHDQPRYIYPPDAPLAITAAPVLDHTDVELRMLEALVNRRPPFDSNQGDGSSTKKY